MILSQHLTISVNPIYNDTKYRILRANVYSSLFWFGVFSAESTINLLTR